jgi:hypothetical protein
MTRSVSIELGDTEYEIEVNYWQAPRKAEGWDPGDGGEIELDSMVSVWGLVEKEVGPGAFNAVPGVVGQLSLDEFIKLYAEHHGIDDPKKASQMLDDEAFENVYNQLEGEYDDAWDE